LLLGHGTVFRKNYKILFKVLDLNKGNFDIIVSVNYNDMKFIPVLLLFFTVSIHAQSISINELKGFLNKSAVTEVKKNIEPKGWKFYRTKNEENGLVSTTWTYKYTAKTDEAVAWLTITSDNNKPVRTMYEIFDFSLTMPFNSSIYESDFKFEHIEQSETEFTKRYATSEFYMWEYQNKDFSKGYQYELIRKYSKADFRNGLTKKYYPSGQLKSEFEMKEGKLHGESKAYYENGKLKKIAHWKADKEEGLAQFFDENGVLLSDETYVNGRLEGPANFYYSNGQISESVNYSFGKKSGESKLYSESGQLEKVINYIGGVKFGAYREYTNGLETFSCFYSNDQLNGLFKESFVNEAGEVYATSSGTMKKNYVDGKYVGMYANKRDTMFVKTFKNERPAGNWRFFDNKGQLEQLVKFNDGHADVQEFYKNKVLTERLKMTKSTDEYWFFTYQLFDGKEQIIAEFRVPAEVLEPNISEFGVFYRETGLNDDRTVVDAPLKFGPYKYDSEYISFEGDYSGGGFKMGVWKRYYKKPKVTAILTFDDTGLLIEELFTKANGKIFNGKLKYTLNGETTTTIEIKNGVRDGYTVEVDQSGKELSRKKYENGYLVE
jgi:antitoxin component YwqK of YwqJK toxin-antitoxin module